jgi:hypothetical protein
VRLPWIDPPRDYAPLKIRQHCAVIPLVIAEIRFAIFAIALQYRTSGEICAVCI